MTNHTLVPCPRCGSAEHSLCVNESAALPWYNAARASPQPFRCPVCHGEGRVLDENSGTSALPRTCHACAGSGIVWGPPR